MEKKVSENQSITDRLKKKMATRYYNLQNQANVFEKIRSHLGVKVETVWFARETKPDTILSLYDRKALSSSWNRIAKVVVKDSRKTHGPFEYRGNRKLYFVYNPNTQKLKIVVRASKTKKRRSRSQSRHGGTCRSGAAGLDIGDFQVKNRNKSETLQAVMFRQRDDGGWTRIASSVALSPGSSSYRIFYPRSFGTSRTYLLIRNVSKDMDFPAVISNDLFEQWPANRKHKITFPTFRTVEMF